MNCLHPPRRAAGEEIDIQGTLRPHSMRCITKIVDNH